MAERPPFDPYAILATLERHRVTYILVGSFARVVRGAEELPDGIDVVPSGRAENLRRLEQALGDLEAMRIDGQPLSLDEDRPDQGSVVELTSPQGALKVVLEPVGTRGYDDLRRATTREYFGRGLRPSVASTGDLARMLGALGREEDVPKLHALRRIAELERSLGHELTL
ncbi:MAG: hypothetical protein ACRDGE_07240 [Candidatus Limnocylindria bacterium]